MSDTTRDIVKENEIDDWKGAMQRLAEPFAGRYPQISEAALGLIAAFDYNDRTLRESSRLSLLAALADGVNDWLASEVAGSEGLQAGLKDGWNKYINMHAHEQSALEDIKTALETIIDERIGAMLKARTFAARLESLGQAVENSQALDDGLRELRQFREDFFRRWPSRTPPAPIDRKAIEEACAAIRRGEKGLTKDQMVWRDKRSEKAS